MPAHACPRCSKTVPAGSAYCRRCGQALRPPARRTPLSEPFRTDGASRAGLAERPGGQKFVLILAVMAVIGIAGAIGLGLSRAKSTANTFHPVARSPDTPDPSRAPAAAPLPPLPSLPPFRRHLPPDLPSKADVPAHLDFRGQLLTQSRYDAERLSGAIFAGAHLVQVTFEKADVRGADFRGAEFLQTTLAGADVEGAKFDGASFSQSRFTSIDTAAVAGQTRVRAGITEPIPPPPLPARNAGRASYRNARFGGTNFDGMDLAGGDFRGALFDGGGFCNADLRGADLRDSRHRMNDFREARLDRADLRGADLTSARNLTDAQLATARTDETTRRPRRW